MRALVCGGRNYSDKARAYAELDRLLPLDGSLYLIVGSANGADRLAANWFWDRTDKVGIIDHYPAEWNKHGKAAGPIRNQKMIDSGKPELVIAFPGGRGTADMIRRAEASGVPVVRITDAVGPPRSCGEKTPLNPGKGCDNG